MFEPLQTTQRKTNLVLILLTTFLVASSICIITFLFSQHSTLTIISPTNEHVNDDQERSDTFIRHSLKAYPEAICNDGGPYALYTDLSSNSKTWVLRLDAGQGCMTEAACKVRETTYPRFIHSEYWEAATREVDKYGGSLAAKPELNPYWYEYNRVFFPYCTSDSYTGTYIYI